MNHYKAELYFLLLFLSGIIVLTFFIFKPFFYPLILALVFATVLGPVHKKVLSSMSSSPSLAALLATIFVLIVVVVPITFLGIQIFQEATQLYSALTENGDTTDLSRTVTDTGRSLLGFSPVPIEFSVDFNQYLKQGLSWLIQHLGPLFANIVKVLLGIFIFLLALYYLFKDGHKLKKIVVALSPLKDNHDETIFNKLTVAINSVIKGYLAIAIIQGVLTAIGFAIFGVPAAVLWGSAAAIAALIPGVGTALVLLPAIFYLYVSGKIFAMLGLLFWGITAVGLIDNFLAPKLLEQGMRLHPLLILLAILGGIGFFGPLGFLLGPLVLSLLFALLEIYFDINNKEQKSPI